MSFLLRILFSGLIAFVPSEDGQEVTVLLLNVDAHHHISDGSAISQHKPLLLARAGSCTGNCPTSDSDIAAYLFRDQSSTNAASSLAAAVSGGGAWLLSGSELSVRKTNTSDPDLPSLTIQTGVRGVDNGVPKPIPTTSAEREDFSWIAELQELCTGTGCALNTSILGSNPPTGLVAARFRIRNGKVFTYSVARIGSKVVPVHFNRLDGSGSTSSYSQAIATWVGADITVSGDSVEIVEDKFDASAGRTMTLEPDSNGKVEIAVLNLPPFTPPASSNNDAPQVGKHFERYYDLVETAPSSETRMVPRPGAAPSLGTIPDVSWTTVHPSSAVYSDLLNSLRLDVGRGPYDRTLCPPVNP